MTERKTWSWWKIFRLAFLTALLMPSRSVRHKIIPWWGIFLYLTVGFNISIADATDNRRECPHDPHGSLSRLVLLSVVWAPMLAGGFLAYEDGKLVLPKNGVTCLSGEERGR